MGKGKTLHGHNGGTGRYQSYLGVHVDSQQAVTVLTHVSPVHPEVRRADLLGVRVMESLLSLGHARD
ncbi:MAG: hypothetical protein AAGA85_21715 [Bacteroidota bacterium]